MVALVILIVGLSHVVAPGFALRLASRMMGGASISWLSALLAVSVVAALGYLPTLLLGDRAEVWVLAGLLNLAAWVTAVHNLTGLELWESIKTAVLSSVLAAVLRVLLWLAAGGVLAAAGALGP